MIAERYCNALMASGSDLDMRAMMLKEYDGFVTKHLKLSERFQMLMFTDESSVFFCRDGDTAMMFHCDEETFVVKVLAFINEYRHLEAELTEAMQRFVNEDIMGDR